MSRTTAIVIALAALASVRIGAQPPFETVFKQGVSFVPAKLIESVSGRVGLW